MGANRAYLNILWRSASSVACNPCGAISLPGGNGRWLPAEPFLREAWGTKSRRQPFISADQSVIALLGALAHGDRLKKNFGKRDSFGTNSCRSSPRVSEPKASSGVSSKL